MAKASAPAIEPVEESEKADVPFDIVLEARTTRYKVTADVVVVVLRSGAEDYVYRGKTLPRDVTESSVEHLLAQGLITPMTVEI